MNCINKNVFKFRDYWMYIRNGCGSTHPGEGTGTVTQEWSGKYTAEYKTRDAGWVPQRAVPVLGLRGLSGHPAGQSGVPLTGPRNGHEGPEPPRR